MHSHNSLGTTSRSPNHLSSLPVSTGSSAADDIAGGSIVASVHDVNWYLLASGSAYNAVADAIVVNGQSGPHWIANRTIKPSGRNGDDGVDFITGGATPDLIVGGGGEDWINR